MPTAIWWDDPAVAARAVGAVPSDPGPQGAATAFLALHGMGKAVLRDLGSKGLVDGSVALDVLKRLDVRGVDAAMAACGVEGSASSMLAQAAMDAAHRMDSWHAAGVPASAACHRAGLVFGVPQRLLSRFEPAARKQVIAPPVLDDLAGRAVMEQARRVFAQCPEPVGKGVVRRRLRYGSDGSVEESEKWDESEHPRDQMGRFRTKPKEAQKQQVKESLGQKAKRMLREKRAKRYERNTRQSLDSRRRMDELERAKKRTVKLKQQKQQVKRTVKEEQKKERISRQKRTLSAQQGFDITSKDGHLDFRTMVSGRMLNMPHKTREIGENGDWQPYITAVQTHNTHNVYVSNGGEEYHVPDVVIKATGTAIALGLKPDELFKFLMGHRGVLESLENRGMARPMALDDDYGIRAIQVWADENDMIGNLDEAQTIAFEIEDDVPIYDMFGYPAISQAQATGMLVQPTMPNYGYFMVSAILGDVGWSNKKEDHIVSEFLDATPQEDSATRTVRLTYDLEDLTEPPLMVAIARNNRMIDPDEFVELYMEFSARAHEQGLSNMDVVLLDGYVNNKGEAVGYWPEFKQSSAGPGLEMTFVPSDKPVRIEDGEIAKSDSDEEWDPDEHPRDVRGRFKYKSVPEQVQRVEERQVQDVSRRRAKRQRRAARMNQLNAQNRAQLLQMKQVQEQRRATLSRQEQAQAKQTLSRQKQTLSRQSRQISQKQTAPPQNVSSSRLPIALTTNYASSRGEIDFPRDGSEGWAKPTHRNIGDFLRDALGVYNNRGSDFNDRAKFASSNRALYHNLPDDPVEVINVLDRNESDYRTVSEFESSPEGLYASPVVADGLSGISSDRPWAKAIRYDLIGSTDGYTIQASVYDDDQVDELFEKPIKAVIATEVSADTVGEDYDWFLRRYKASRGDDRVVRSDEFFMLFDDIPPGYGVVEMPVGSKAGYTGPVPIELRFR